MVLVELDVLEIIERGGQPAIHVDLPVDGVEVSLYRVLGNGEAVGDFLVARTAGKEGEDLSIPGE